MRNEILKELWTNRDRYISGAQIAQEFGVSRVAIWKQIESLKKEGYDIISTRSKGYRLVNAGEVIIPELIEQKNSIIGRRVISFSVLDSTNEHCKRLLAEGSIDEGTVVVAREQRNARGRMGRHWEAPSGGLWFSFVLQPDLPIAQLALLSLVFAVAVADCLNGLISEKCLVKWPNDIYVSGKKVAGILLELIGEIHGTKYLVVGIGVNTAVDKSRFSESLREVAGSLSNYGLKGLNAEILEQLLKHLEIYYREFLLQGFQPIRKKFKDLCFHMGSLVEVPVEKEKLQGINIDIDDTGALIINTGERLIHINTGDVNVVKEG
ncbi:MAG: biotin--[acetyl-CoA-carboxylase] ligase [Syntrophomonadaceae bacterium]